MKKHLISNTALRDPIAQLNNGVHRPVLKGNFSGGTYQVIYADPPWQYRNKKTGGSMVSGAETKYPTMSVEEICSLQIPSDKNAVLFLWATVPFLREAFQVMDAWGFKYKTMLTWQKINSFGMGFWWRGQCEHLLFGVKGQVKAFRMQEPNFIQAKPEKHSQKPQEFRDLIERATPHLPHKLELFARNEFDGWHSWGNEIESDISIESGSVKKIFLKALG